MQKFILLTEHLINPCLWASVDSMFYQLLLRKRDVQYNRIIGGDHTLRINKYHSKRKHFVRNIRSILKWFEKT